MRVRTLAVGLLLTGLVAITGACNREPKPDHDGIFIITEKQIAEVMPAPVDTDFTDEGFAVRYFAGEPNVIFKSDKSYFILNGGPTPVDLLAFRNAGARFEQDTSKGDLRAALQQSGLSGEEKMVKVKVGQHLAVGTYALQVQEGSETLFYPFRVE